MKNFIIQYNFAKTFSRNIYYCNKKKKYFVLGHLIPGKCCDLIKSFGSNPVQEILINQLCSVRISAYAHATTKKD